MKSYPPPFNWFERSIFKRAAGALPGNKEALAVLRDRGFSGPAVVIPHHGIDVNLFQKQDASSLRSKLGLNGLFLVGYIGRIVNDKGIHTLVRAIAQLPSQCTLLIVGTGTSRFELEEIVRDLGLATRVRWIPWVPTTQLPEYMNVLDALILPSRTTAHWKEQLGRVLLEAMACETCVVGSDSGEIPNVIGDAGLIFHEDDEYDLARCLRRLMNDGSFRDSLRRSGRERVLNHFSDNRVANETAVFYRSISEYDSNERTKSAARLQYEGVVL